MIVTLTANPSIDRTVGLDAPLVPGGVHRSRAVIDQPGGKGVNVSRVVAAAGHDTVAVVPARDGDPFVAALAEVRVPFVACPAGGEVRVNLTIADPDGVTTKINAPGAPLGETERDALVEMLSSQARGAEWVTLCGSLPPGPSADWYALLAESLHGVGVKVAVDTSGPPLLAAGGARPDLMKPNAEELAELTGADPQLMETLAARGDHSLAADASVDLATRTGGAVLTTLGGAGALLATGAGVWFAGAPKVRVRSTVGAGDASLAGYLLAAQRGAEPAQCLATAVAYGSAAAALPGTTPPTPDLVHPEEATVTRIR